MEIKMSHKKSDEDRLRDCSPVSVRLHPDLKNWLAEQAKQSHRSMSSEIAYRIEQIRLKDEQTA